MEHIEIQRRKGPNHPHRFSTVIAVVSLNRGLVEHHVFRPIVTDYKWSGSHTQLLGVALAKEKVHKAVWKWKARSCNI